MADSFASFISLHPKTLVSTVLNRFMTDDSFFFCLKTSFWDDTVLKHPIRPMLILILSPGVTLENKFWIKVIVWSNAFKKRNVKRKNAGLVKMSFGKNES